MDDGGDLARLRSVLDWLPVAPLPPRALNVGCGTFACARTLHDARPAWRLVGVDIDGDALRQARHHAPWLELIQADARRLPLPREMAFGLILVRHPDLFRQPAAWSAIIPALPARLAPGGALLITVYTTDEARLVLGLPLIPAPIVLNNHGLPPADLVGRDRVALAVLRQPH